MGFTQMSDDELMWMMNYDFLILFDGEWIGKICQINDELMIDDDE